MSDSIVHNFIGRLSAISSSTWADARKYGAIAIIAAIGWSLAIALMSWLGQKYGWSATGRWSDLLLQGLVSIAIVCGGCLGISVASAKPIDGASHPGGLGQSVDRLEVRGLSWIVGRHADAAASQALAAARSDEYGGSRDTGGMVAAYGNQSLSRGPFARAFDRIASALPNDRPIPTLVWPGKSGRIEAIDLTLAAQQTGYYGLTFALQDAPVNQLDSSDVEAAFSVFDDQPNLALLLVLSADGPSVSMGTPPQLESSVSFVLLMRPEHAGRPGGAQPSAESGLGQRMKDSRESGNVVSSLETSIVGFIHRPCRATTDATGQSSSSEAIRGAWASAIRGVSEEGVSRAVLIGAGSSGLRPIVHELLNTSPLSPDDSIRIIDVNESTPSMAYGTSLCQLVCVMETMTELKNPVAAIERIPDGALVTLVSPPV